MMYSSYVSGLTPNSGGLSGLNSNWMNSATDHLYGLKDNLYSMKDFSNPPSYGQDSSDDTDTNDTFYGGKDSGVGIGGYTNPYNYLGARQSSDSYANPFGTGGLANASSKSLNPKRSGGNSDVFGGVGGIGGGSTYDSANYNGGIGASTLGYGLGGGVLGNTKSSITSQMYSNANKSSNPLSSSFKEPTNPISSLAKKSTPSPSSPYAPAPYQHPSSTANGSKAFSGGASDTFQSRTLDSSYGGMGKGSGMITGGGGGGGGAAASISAGIVKPSISGASSAAAKPSVPNTFNNPNASNHPPNASNHHPNNASSAAAAAKVSSPNLSAPSPSPLPHPSSSSSSASPNPVIATPRPSDPTWTQPLRRSDFEWIRIIGQGTFGLVWVARHLKNKEVVAIKCLDKLHIIRRNQVAHVHDERNLLQSTDHPFVVKIRSSFQDDSTIYLVMEFVSGGEFFAYLRQNGTFRGREEKARFYVAQMVLVLEHLHSRGIVYRDLKPENLLIAPDGYLKFTDFGFAKRLGVGSNARKTLTTCGTPDYIAPEVIRGGGYGLAADLWALGCITLELMSGYPPFYTGQASETYTRILKNDWKCPDYLGHWAKRFIEALLQQQPEKRLGMGPRGFKEIKEDTWFQNLDWDIVIRRKYQPPYVPEATTLEDQLNSPNFDRFEAENQRAKEGGGAGEAKERLSPEQQRLFQYF